MSNVKIAWWIFLSAAGLGVFADFMLNGQKLGINVFVILCLGLVSLEFIAWRNNVPFRMEARALLWCSTVFALMIGIRDSVVMIALDFLAIGMIRIMVSLRSRNGAFLNGAVTEFFLGVFSVWFETLFGFIGLMRNDLNWKDVSNKRRISIAVTAGKGFFVALPLLFLFGGLFSSADVQFHVLLLQLFNWNFPVVWSHFWITLLCSVLACGALKVLLMWDRSTPSAPGTNWLTLGGGEICVALGLLNVLFLAFVMVQFEYVFGFSHSVHLSSGMAYRAYTRSGFFELVWVTAFVLPVLLGFHRLLTSPTKLQLTLFRLLSFALVLQLFVVMLSAFHRLHLYVQAYGLTQLRLYSSTFMVWLAIVFVWFLLTVLLERKERFAFGAAVSGLGVILLLNILNPDRFIVQYNVTHPGTVAPMDVDYYQTLSADAAPAMLSFALKAKDAQSTAEVAKTLLDQQNDLRIRDWRSWNWSRQTELDEVQEHKSELAKVK